METAKGYIKEISFLLEHDIVISEGQFLGCSIGLTSYDIASGQTGEELLSAADQALYEAKSAGKHCLKIWRGREAAVSESCQ